MYEIESLVLLPEERIYAELVCYRRGFNGCFSDEVVWDNLIISQSAAVNC